MHWSVVIFLDNFNTVTVFVDLALAGNKSETTVKKNTNFFIKIFMFNIDNKPIKKIKLQLTFK